MKRIVFVAAMIAAAGTLAWAGEVQFSTKPAAVRQGEKVTIRFAVSAATDVEVAVIGPDGKVVRYLAAGVLGGAKPPPPPLKAGLAQEVVWDGTDETGQPAGAGPFTFRVRAGTSVKFGRFLGDSPYTGSLNSGPSDSLAVDADGSLYVKLGSFVPQLHERMPWQIRKLDREGNYVKTVLPHPPSTDPAKAVGFKLLAAADGLLTPASMTPLDPVLFHLGDNICPRTVGGCLVFVDARAGVLNFLKLDGSNELKPVPMRSKPDALKWSHVNPQVAFSPDGKLAYYANLANIPYDPKTPAAIDANFPQGRIYRHTIGQGDAEKFFDLTLPDWTTAKHWVPNAWNKRSAASCIDVDGQGNVLVGDLVSQQVVEVSPQGKLLSATKVDWPDKLAVARKSGALYVVSRKVSDGYPPAGELVKIVGRGDSARAVARLPLPRTLGFTIAVDESGESPVVWVGGGADLIRVEDRGEQLVVTVPRVLNRSDDAIGFVCYADVDAEADLVYVTEGLGKVWRYDGLTGEGGRIPLKSVDLAVGPGGLVYTWGEQGWHGSVMRYGRDLKPAPIAKTGKHSYGSLSGRYGRGNSVCGMDVDARGRVYAVYGGNACHVRVYDADGQPVAYERTAAGTGKDAAPSPAAVTGVDGHGGSIRVDPAGNMYILQLGLPKDFAPPAGFEKDPAYLRCTGTIHKFGPAGGQLGKGGPVGVLDSYPGCAPLSGRWSSTSSVCVCTKPRFDVDRAGRLIVPNAFTFKVAVADNAGNPIVSFGGYGNLDAGGPASKEPKPDIPLGWPITANATDRHVYVGDCLNHRVVRVDKVFAAEETCRAD